jgi:hypothetical protein
MISLHVMLKVLFKQTRGLRNTLVICLKGLEKVVSMKDLLEL